MESPRFHCQRCCTTLYTLTVLLRRSEKHGTKEYHTFTSFTLFTLTLHPVGLKFGNGQAEGWITQQEIFSPYMSRFRSRPYARTMLVDAVVSEAVCRCGA
jgi:hypothetical protein